MPTHLNICQCGKHGHFVLEDKSLSPETCFKQHALHIIYCGVRVGLLKDDEVSKLIEEVTSSYLPRTPDETDLTILFNTELFNQATDEGIKILYDGEYLCSVLHDSSSLPLVPDDFLEQVCRSIQSFQPS